MKKLLNGVWRCNRKSFALQFLIATIILIGLAACQKDVINAPEEQMQSTMAKNSQADVLSMYTGLARETAWELQQARAATARYRNFDNAVKDGYADINVVLPQMGYHYMKADLLDDKFDYKSPEILVYNKDDEGNLQLVAVEYAIPLDLSVNAPQGFTGNTDVWNRNTGFGLWLLHAWVWNYNPDGVFNPTNPSVHLH